MHERQNAMICLLYTLRAGVCCRLRNATTHFELGTAGGLHLLQLLRELRLALLIQQLLLLQVEVGRRQRRAQCCLRCLPCQEQL